jgi:microcystin-dependent protein
MLPWGDFYPSGWKAPTVPAVSAVKTYNAAGIWVQPAGVTAAYDRVQAAPNELSAWAARVSGVPGMTSLKIGTYLTPDIAANLLNTSLVISVQIKNNTNNPMRPILTLSTSNVLGDPENTADIHTAESAVQCEPQRWTRVTWTVHTAALINWVLGCQISIGLPGLTETAQNIITCQWDVRVGTTAGVSERFNAPTREPRILSTVPPATLLAFMGTAALPPSGYFWANGDAVSRTLYKELFEALGIKYGPGDGIATFNLPDLRERTLAGSTAMGGLPISGRASQAVTITTESAKDTVVLSAAAAILPGSILVGPGIPENTRVLGYFGNSTTLKISSPATATASVVAANIYPASWDAKTPPLSYEPQGAFITKLVVAAANTSILVLSGLAGAALEDLALNDVDIGMEVSHEALPVGPRAKIIAFSYASNKFRIHLDRPVLAAINASAPVRFHYPTDYAERQLLRAKHGRYAQIAECKTVVGSTDIVCALWFVLVPGMRVAGPGIPPETTVTDFPGANKIRLSKPATVSSTANVTLTFELDAEFDSLPGTANYIQTCNFIIKH